MRRITVFCGHYGSGKTNVAINYALHLKESGYETAIADIDIVNPYFRTKDSEKELVRAGVRVLSLPYANTNVDLPSIPSEMNSLFQNKNEFAVLDVGGDDRGAYALGRFAPIITEERNFDCFYVTNFFRPLTPDAESALEVMDEIENACGIPFTGIVNNSNLGEETTEADILAGYEKAKELSELTCLPIMINTVKEDLEIKSKLPNLFKIKLQKKLW